MFFVGKTTIKLTGLMIFCDETVRYLQFNGDETTFRLVKAMFGQQIAPFHHKPNRTQARMTQ
jgi:hypothetical protein